MSNKQIVNLIEERLEKGKREYSEQLDVHDGRDWTKESLEEALDLCIYITAEILRRNDIVQPEYRYFGCARFEDMENGLISLESKKSMSWEDIQLRMAYEMNLDLFGSNYDDWMPVYIDQVVVIATAQNKGVSVFNDGFVEPEDIIPD